MATYGIKQRVEAAIIPLLLVHVLVLSRLIGHVYLCGQRKTAALLFIFIACAPHALNYASSLYTDSAFSVAFLAVCFEVWLALTRQNVTNATLIMIGLLLPMAGLFKSNGLIILLPVLYLAYHAKGVARYWRVFFCIFWLSAPPLPAAKPCIWARGIALSGRWCCLKLSTSCRLSQ